MANRRIFSMRLSPQERADLERVASDRGFPSSGAWLRAIIRAYAEKDRKQGREA